MSKIVLPWFKPCYNFTVSVVFAPRFPDSFQALHVLDSLCKIFVTSRVEFERIENGGGQRVDHFEELKVIRR